MQIKPAALLNIITYTELQEKKLKIGAAMVCIRRHFCSQMTASNKCTKHCNECALHIQNAMRGIETAKSPEGMLVNRLRHEFAGIEEKADETKKPTVDLDKFGKPTHADMFANILAEVS